MSVAVATTPSFQAETPKRLFDDPSLIRNTAHTYDVAADGERFVMVENVESDSAKPLSIHMVENWHQEFRDHRQD